MPEMNIEKSIDIENMSKWFGDFQVLDDINLSVCEGEKIVVCGPSGSGKSTMIRCINGLESFQGGRITVNGVALSQKSKVLDAVRKNVGMVFQQFNLFPHLTVLENCTLALRWVHKVPRQEADDIARRYLKRVRIPSRRISIPGSFPAGSSSVWQ